MGAGLADTRVVLRSLASPVHCVNEPPRDSTLGKWIRSCRQTYSDGQRTFFLAAYKNPIIASNYRVTDTSLVELSPSGLSRSSPSQGALTDQYLCLPAEEQGPPKRRPTFSSRSPRKMGKENSRSLTNLNRPPRKVNETLRQIFVRFCGLPAVPASIEVGSGWARVVPDHGQAERGGAIRQAP